MNNEFGGFLPMFAGRWWVSMVRGVIAVLFGLMALFWPGLTLATLLIVFGIFAVIDGIMTIILALRVRAASEQWWTWLADGVLTLAIGLMALFWPGATAVVFMLWIAAWAIIAGVMRLVAAIRLRRIIDNEWSLGLSGLLSVLLGVAIAVMPAAGLLSLAWLIGIFAILFGLAMIALALRIRRLMV